MPRVEWADKEYRAAARFRNICMPAGQSYLSQSLELWTHDNLVRATEILMSPNIGSGTYMERLEEQLKSSPANIYRLIAEAMILYSLFPSSDVLKASTKKARVETILKWGGVAVDQETLNETFGDGIGAVGTHYMSAQPYLLNFFIHFALEGKTRNIDFGDREQCQNVADAIRAEYKHVVEARHALLHLFFPDYYESIVSDTHKKQILETYRDLAVDPGGDIDLALQSIRSNLSKQLGHDVDYYDAEFRQTWDKRDETEPTAITDAIPSYQRIMLPYLQLISDGENHRESDLLDPLAATLSLSKEDRERKVPGGLERAFDNRIRWATLNLRQARLVEVSSEGSIRITNRGKELLLEQPAELTRTFLRRYPEYDAWVKGDQKPDAQIPAAGNVWIEKTITENRPDRLSGEYSVGKALWSPQKDSAGRDTYRFMRDVRPGDIILHLTDNRGFTGVSIASSGLEEFNGVSGTQWGDRPCYLIRLSRYTSVDPPLLKETFFSPPFRDRLIDIRRRERNLFYTEGVRLEGLRSLEGFYLTPAPSDLVAALNDAYIDLTGRQLIDSPIGEPEPANRIAYTFDDLLRTTLWAEADLNELLDTLAANATCKQVILSGPPGTGKTWVAMQVVKYLANDDSTRWRLVQFHPSYSYEQFVEGLRPVSEGGAISFKPVKGLLLEMAGRSKLNRDSHFLIMDEMNRANLPRVLGELLFLFEYRQAKIDLPYTKDFMLPDNLFFIGTMNTADRSIRSVDAALRRRVEIFECLPNRQILEKYYETNTNQVTDLFEGFDKLNKALTDKLDRHHTVGHTYFMAPVFSPATLQLAWRRKIQPLIEEYFFDRTDELEAFTITSFWPSMA